MLELIIFSIFGCITGVIVGLLPGISNSTAMVLFYPLLMKIDSNNTIAFYIGMITCTQYFGAASASLLGIPTETSCLPSMTEGYFLVRKGKITEALSANVWSSLVGSLIGIILGLSIFLLGNNYSIFFNFKLQFALLFLTIAVTIFSSNNWVLSIILCISGYILGMIGVNPITRQEFLTFQNPYLINGIPPIIVLVFLYSLPLMMNLSLKNINKIKAKDVTYKFILPAYTTIRSSIIGFICGFIPMIGIVISSNLSYSLEKFLNRKQYKFGNINALVSSDSAHSAALVSSLIPLFCFAIPIVSSEYMLYDITSNRGMVYNLDWLLANYSWILAVFFLVNIIGFVLSYPFAVNLVNLVIDKINKLKTIGLILLLFSVFEMGYIENQLIFYIILAAVFFPVGWVIRKIDLMPLVLSFLIAQQFDAVIRVVYNLYLKG